MKTAWNSHKTVKLMEQSGNPRNKSIHLWFYYNKGINIISIDVELINQYAKASIPLMRTGWTNISTWDINFYFNKKKHVTTFCLE